MFGCRGWVLQHARIIQQKITFAPIFFAILTVVTNAVLLVCAIAKIEQLMDKFSKLSKKSVFFRVNPRPKKSSTKGIV